MTDTIIKDIVLIDSNDRAFAAIAQDDTVTGATLPSGFKVPDAAEGWC